MDTMTKYYVNLEMQMYYILDDQTADEPKKLFSGNIALCGTCRLEFAFDYGCLQIATIMITVRR